MDTLYIIYELDACYVAVLSISWFSSPFEDHELSSQVQLGAVMVVFINIGPLRETSTHKNLFVSK